MSSDEESLSLSLSTPLRKVAAFYDLPSLATPERPSNPSSYPFRRPPPGERVTDESPLPPTISQDSPNPFNPEIKDSIENWLSEIVEGDHHDMYRFSEKYGSEPSSPGGSPRAWIPVPRRGSWMLTPRRAALIFGACFGVWVLNSFMSRVKQHGVILSHFAYCGCHLVC